MRQLLLILLMTAFSIQAVGQTDVDSLVRHEFTGAGLPYLVLGGVASFTENGFRKNAGTFEERGNTVLDNVGQYAPLGTVIVLKALGVKTRSGWGRFATSTAFSAAIMASLSEGLKHTVNERRPDGSNKHSFPSGHTAIAFMGAQIMSKELGWRSPWFTIGAYSLATTTAILRIHGNRHWTNDVIFGAGIGITSVDLGYLITDFIFKDRQLDPSYKPVRGTLSPSFFSSSMGVTTGMRLHAPMQIKSKPGLGTSLTLEGAWFVNDFVGLGGRLRATATPVAFEDTSIESGTIGTLNIAAGGYFSYPIHPRFRMGTNLTLGDYIVTSFKTDSEGREDYLEIGGSNSLSVSTGLSLTYLLQANTSMRLSADYTHSEPTLNYKLDGTDLGSRKAITNAVTISLAVATNF